MPEHVHIVAWPLRGYVRQNPVRRGLVKKTEDYPWLWERELPLL